MLLLLVAYFLTLKKVYYEKKLYLSSVWMASRLRSLYWLLSVSLNLATLAGYWTRISLLYNPVLVDRCAWLIMDLGDVTQDLMFVYQEPYWLICFPRSIFFLFLKARSLIAQAGLGLTRQAGQAWNLQSFCLKLSSSWDHSSALPGPEESTF